MNNFSKGQVGGQHVDYLFYVEGVLVPIQSFTISVAVSQPATLVAEIAPFPEGITNLKKNMRVFLFKRMNKESLPRLRFSGIITGHLYTKSFGQRTLRIECASSNYKWQTMVSNCINTKQFSGASEAMLSNAKQRIESGEAKKKVAEAKQKLEKAKAENQSDENIKKLREELKLAELDYYQARNLYNSASMTSNVYRAGAFRAGIANLQDWDKQAYSNNLIDNGRTNYARSSQENEDQAPKKQDFNLVTSFDKLIKKNNDFMEALFLIIEEAYLQADPCSARDYRTFLENSFPEYLHIFDPKLEVTTDSQNDPSVYAFVKREFNRALNHTAAGSPFINTLLAIMESMFIKFSVDPLAIVGQILFYPLMNSFIPPRCNVLFPNMYSEINMHIDDWKEPTRSFVIYPPFGTTGSEAFSSEVENSETAAQEILARTTGVLCDSMDPFLKKADIDVAMHKDENTGKSTGVVDTQAEKQNIKKIMDIVTQDEQETGVTLNTVQLPHNFMTNMNTSDRVRFADFIHGMAKYAVRQCSVMGCIVDDMIVGMPVLILDGNYSIHGTLESMQYSVSSDGSYGCSLNIGYPKFVFLGDTLQAPPLWLKDIEKLGSIENIGNAYQQRFGCSSVYDKDKDTEVDSNSETDMTSLARITTRLLNEFNENDDRWKYTEDYRKRNELTTEDVFVDIYKCKAASNESTKDDDRVLQYTDGPFKSYTITEYQNSETKSLLSGGETQYTPIDKPAKVNEYLNDIYRQSAGVTAGILAGDCDLDNKAMFEIKVTKK